MVQLISKHWIYANTQGAFSDYAIDPQDEKPVKILGVITRWLIGKKSFLARERTQVDLERMKLSKQKGRWRSSLSSHRTTSIKSLVAGEFPSCFSAFEESRCHSDTETIPSGKLFKLKLPWRSAIFAALCKIADRKTIERLRQQAGRHFSPSQLFETKRCEATTTEEQALVPMNLPVDCYDDEFLNSLSQQARRELTNKPSCGLANIYFQLTQGIPNNTHQT
ncbi:hypothetical protein PGT21_031545 [Puccinia graminis f. sp. tritici]|uniref:Uncharacterized protein n=1 Tax=Puccinia graminis f. sp. tritici TaxID=56615 RepID=A0A5B0Q702_PUCGR|nr:hypothetical protein PGT21_031545 [Puccinia graminis f. sp. tritici]